MFAPTDTTTDTTTATSTTDTTTDAIEATTPTRTQHVRRTLRHALVVVLAVLALSTTIVAAAPAPEAHALNPNQTTVHGVVTLLAGDQYASLNRYWAWWFSRWGRTWAPPRGIHYYGDFGHLNTGCGTTTASQPNNAFYCSGVGDGRIYIDYYWMQDLMDAGGRFNYGDYAAGGIVAHEFAHRVQHVLGGGRLSNDYRAEYNADCLTGMYTRYLYRAGRATGGDYWEFHNWLTSVANTESHGNPQSRAAWYYAGYAYENFSVCDGAYRAAR